MIEINDNPLKLSMNAGEDIEEDIGTYLRKKIQFLKEK
jgi:hypothetical protein